jgi:hypothetical protein
LNGGGNEILPACPNCGTSAADNYCAHCGQRTGSRRVTVRRLLRDVVEDQFSVNSALPCTLRGLAKPGFLTTEYVAGRIARYIAPFRLFLLTSFLFFFGMAWFDRGELVISSTSTDPTLRSDTTAAVAASAAPASGSNEWVITLGEAFGIDMKSRLLRMARMDATELGRLFLRDLVERMSFAVLLMVPLFAGLLRLLYLEQDHLYVEHFVFTLHVHSFAFLLFALQMPVRGAPWIPGLFAVALLIYGFLALRHFHRQNFIETSIKFALLSLLYLLLLGAAALTTLTVTFLLMPL